MNFLSKLAFALLCLVGPALTAWAGASVNYEYDDYGNCIAVTTLSADNTVLEKSTYTYDAYRRCTSQTEAADTAQSRTWNWIYDRYFGEVGFGASTHTSKQWRVQIEPAYNSAGDRPLSANWFDYNDQIVQVHTGLFAYANGAWDSGPDTETHFFSYDENGNKKTSTDPRGRLTEYEYNRKDRLKKSTEHPLAGETPGDLRVTETTYDTVGNKKLVKFPDMRTQQWLDYDAFGQAGRFIDERIHTTNMTYCWGPMKKLYTVTTHRDRGDNSTEDQLTTFSYDLMGKPTQVLFPDGSDEFSTYQSGQLKTFQTRKDQVKTINYDARGREISHSWSDAATPGVSRSWDDANRVLTLCNIYSTIDFGYDGAGLVLWEGNMIAGSGSRRQTTFHRYPRGAVSDIQYPDGIWIHRDYSARGQLKAVEDSLSSEPVITYSYLPDGKMEHADYQNGVRSAFAYDGRGMTRTVNHFKLSSQENHSSREYTRDTRDRIISFKKGTIGSNLVENGRGDRFSYDDEGQLLEGWYDAVDPANSGSGNSRYDGFSYDALGNRGSGNFVASRGPLDFTLKGNGLNQYRTWGPWDTSYDDDIGGTWGSPGRANGVLMQEGNITAGFNALNQPMYIQGTVYNGTQNWVNFGYDPLGRPVKRWVGPLDGASQMPPDTNPATYFYYDGWNLIQEGPSSTSATRNYVHGARVDEIVKQITPANWWERYFHYDARGHCTLQTDGSGNVIERYEYDAFGHPYFYDASGNNIGHSPWGNRFLFTGREYLSELKLYDYRNRMYQPELGRFLQPDPKHFATGDYNLYRYCHNDPVNKSDPTGLIWDVPDKLKKDFDIARAAVSKDPIVKAIFDRIEKDKKHTVTIVETKKLGRNLDQIQGTNKGNSTFAWNPRAAVAFSGGSQSPATVLVHEAAHADRIASDPIAARNDFAAGDGPMGRAGPFGNMEDKRVILGPEARAANVLKEDSRSSAAGVHYQVTTVLGR